MSINSYVDSKFKLNGRPGKAYYKAVSDGLNKFIKHNGWYINLPEEENRNSSVDLECSYLCHGIWTKLTKNESNNGRPYSNNYFYLKHNRNENEILFHFDIMNNPKKKSCGLAKYCNEQELQNWQRIYHSIGNMTPIPWFKVKGEHYINGQALHNALDERWDLFLNTLEKNWNIWNSTSSFTFKSYMLLTYQHMYYKDIYVDYKSNVKKIENINLKILKKWNKYIIKNNNLKIISFLDLDYKEESIASLITDLIKIRCHIIGLLLKEN